MPHLSRRTFISSAIALATCPLSAQGNDWQTVTRAARALDQCHAIVIYQSGKQVLAERFRGPAINRVVPIKSVSKTLVAALAGAAIDRGEIPSVKSTLGDLTPHLIPSKADAKVAAITIENLITMQAGLERTSGRNYGGWVNSNNWVANALSRLTVEGMVRFGEMYLNEGRVGDNQVLSTHWVGQSMLPVTRSVFSGLEYGYGWFLGQSSGTPYAMARGYGGQIICIIPELKLTIAITSDPMRLARSGGYFDDLLSLIEKSIVPIARRENV